MHSVLILWAPDTAENRRVVEAVTSAFDAAMLAPLAKKVTEATIADITAAEIIVFGHAEDELRRPPSRLHGVRPRFQGYHPRGKNGGVFLHRHGEGDGPAAQGVEGHRDIDARGRSPLLRPEVRRSPPR